MASRFWKSFRGFPEGSPKDARRDVYLLPGPYN